LQPWTGKNNTKTKGREKEIDGIQNQISSAQLKNPSQKTKTNISLHVEPCGRALRFFLY
jgi:hypothetical protein